MAETTGGTHIGAGESNVDGAEPLTHLYKMSPTAGVATTDYAAVNVMAIVALLLGLASVLVLFSAFLLLVPLAGVICAFIAIRQIRNSSGTQVGWGLALGGLILCLLFGGTTGVAHAVRAIRAGADERQIAALLERVGSQIRDGQYQAAYGEFSERFRRRVPGDLFAREWEAINSQPQFGKVESIRWNGQPMLFEVNPDSGTQIVTAMALEKTARLDDPAREVMVFTKQGGRWVVEDIPRLFPAKKGPAAIDAGG